MLVSSWSDEYNTGIPVIDWQHKTILAAIESLGFNAKESNDPSILHIGREPRTRRPEQLEHLQDNFDFIYCYWVDHTHLEETFMKLHNYPELDYKLHKKRHKEMFGEALKIRVLLETLPIKDISDKLKDLFLHHILEDDLLYVDYISEHKKVSK